jgi:uncharacterized protein YbjT (DUF2867 family)
MRILVTGASGNVGSEVAESLLAGEHEVLAGTRDGRPVPGSDAIPVVVDFEKGTAPPQPVDAIFLMRPPQITDPEVFARFLGPYPRDVRVVFLSVQGAGTKSYLPHARIEKKIVELGFAHVFVRPSYFMENLLTTLWPELERNRRIFLPAGKLKLDWVSVRDVAAACVASLEGKAAGTTVTVCSGTLTGFAEVCEAINRIVGTRIEHEPAGLIGFVRYSRRQGISWQYIAVMLLLHFLPRMERVSPEPCTEVRTLLGRAPETLESFIERNQSRFEDLL